MQGLSGRGFFLPDSWALYPPLESLFTHDWSSLGVISSSVLLVSSNPPVVAMAMIPNKTDAERYTGPTYPPGIYFLNTRTNAGTINATNPDPSVVTVPISA